MGIIVSVVWGAAWWASSVSAKVETVDAKANSNSEAISEVVNELKEVNITLVEIKTVLKQKKRDD